MYIHGELERHGFKVASVHHFGDPNRCHVDYEFKNDKIRAIFKRNFNGKICLTFSEEGRDEEVEFADDTVEDEVQVIQLIRQFLARHA